MGSKKKKRKQEKRFAPLRAKLFAKGILGGREIVPPPRGDKKMSQVLIEFIEPYAEHADTDESFNKLLTIGIVAWNASLLPGKDREDLIDKTITVLQPELRQDMKAILEGMMQRKVAQFGHIRRMIIDYEMEKSARGWHVVVASTLSA
jgi:hypothetical protein